MIAIFEPYLADYRYYALFNDQRLMSDVSNAVGLYRSVSAYDEERYEGHGRWGSSSGLSRSGDRDSYDDYREATPAEVEQLRRRTDAEQPEPRPPSSSREKNEDGCFAVFEHEADMVDLRSAIAVVEELSPEHRFTLPLGGYLRTELTAVLALLAARRRAEPVDGHYYFAEFESLKDVVDVDRAHALIRCPADGRGNWEIFLRDGTWVLGQEPRQKHVLPVGSENVERISRGRETAKVRYFDVWLGGTTEGGLYRHVLVRRTGSADETVDDLGWQPTDVFARLEPGWWVLELGERGFRSSRYVAAMRRRWPDRHNQALNYQAVFAEKDDVYDLGKVLFLAKRVDNPYELEYELWTPDGWQKTYNMLLRYTTLPISEKEFKRLAKLRRYPNSLNP
ncbi:hypothetical protein UK23_26660 [Lentzea aerocolonigenes]|uniref:Uncharacterized protein n=1 Tax=Lentzea aerocolonigenes TaxID=68170 RepID=A0A0F0GP71_LENAE|nr:hypothetical protein [Lentzea aerocolonigenes]KJK45294.1 hypothetical protein UK23_26660 [Lentzea aerocolonigenes]